MPADAADPANALNCNASNARAGGKQHVARSLLLLLLLSLVCLLLLLFVIVIFDLLCAQIHVLHSCMQQTCNTATTLRWHNKILLQCERLEIKAETTKIKNKI